MWKSNDLVKREDNAENDGENNNTNMWKSNGLVKREENGEKKKNMKEMRIVFGKGSSIYCKQPMFTILISLSKTIKRAKTKQQSFIQSIDSLQIQTQM